MQNLPLSFQCVSKCSEIICVFVLSPVSSLESRRPYIEAVLEIYEWQERDVRTLEAAFEIYEW